MSGGDKQATCLADWPVRCRPVRAAPATNCCSCAGRRCWPGRTVIELIPTWFFPACAAQGCKPHPDTRMYRGETTSSPHALRTDSDAELKIAIRAAGLETV